MRIHFLFATAFLLILFCQVSCNKPFEVRIRFENVDGIRKGTPVAIDGFNVGKVKNMYISDSNSVITIVEIDNEIKLYTDASFRITSGLTGEHIIILNTGESGQLLDQNALIIGISEEKSWSRDSTGMELGGILKSIFKKDNTKQDSILIELRRLNENLEKLENK